MSYCDIFRLGNGRVGSGVESLLFLGTAGGSSDRCELSERVSKEGDDVFDRSLED